MSKTQKYQIDSVNSQTLKAIIADFVPKLKITDHWLNQQVAAFETGEYQTVEVSYINPETSSDANPPSYSDALPKTHLPLMNNNGLTLAFSSRKDPNARVIPSISNDENIQIHSFG